VPGLFKVQVLAQRPRSFVTAAALLDNFRGNLARGALIPAAQAQRPGSARLNIFVISSVVGARVAAQALEREPDRRNPRRDRHFRLSQPLERDTMGTPLEAEPMAVGEQFLALRGWSAGKHARLS